MHRVDPGLIGPKVGTYFSNLNADPSIVSLGRSSESILLRLIQHPRQRQLAPVSWSSILKSISRADQGNGWVRILIEYALLTGIISAVLVLALSALAPKVNGPYASYQRGASPTGGSSPGVRAPQIPATAIRTPATAIRTREREPEPRRRGWESEPGDAGMAVGVRAADAPAGADDYTTLTLMVPATTPTESHRARDRSAVIPAITARLVLGSLVVLLIAGFRRAFPPAGQFQPGEGRRRVLPGRG